MSFPDTRQSLIQRIAVSNSVVDWQQFLNDYWGPVSRFAAVQGNLSWHDAEDVAAQTFEIVVRNKLLQKWTSHRTAKLRTLLCSVVRNVLANRLRIEQGRQRNLQEQAEAGIAGPWIFDETAAAEVDIFYASWVDDLLLQAAETLMTSLHSEGKGNYYRVLYGRVCQQMTVKDIAADLNITQTNAENYFKAARKRLAAQLEDLVRQHVARYCDSTELIEQFDEEWLHLGNYLDEHGGLEAALRRAYAPTPGGEVDLSGRHRRIRETLDRSLPPEPPAELD